MKSDIKIFLLRLSWGHFRNACGGLIDHATLHSWVDLWFLSWWMKSGRRPDKWPNSLFIFSHTHQFAKSGIYLRVSFPHFSPNELQVSATAQEYPCSYNRTANLANYRSIDLSTLSQIFFRTIFPWICHINHLHLKSYWEWCKPRWTIYWPHSTRKNVLRSSFLQKSHQKALAAVCDFAGSHRSRVPVSVICVGTIIAWERLSSTFEMIFQWKLCDTLLQRNRYFMTSSVLDFACHE